MRVQVKWNPQRFSRFEDRPQLLFTQIPISCAAMQHWRRAGRVPGCIAPTLSPQVRGRSWQSCITLESLRRGMNCRRKVIVGRSRQINRDLGIEILDTRRSKRKGRDIDAQLRSWPRGARLQDPAVDARLLLRSTASVPGHSSGDRQTSILASPRRSLSALPARRFSLCLSLNVAGFDEFARTLRSQKLRHKDVFYAEMPIRNALFNVIAQHRLESFAIRRYAIGPPILP